ncbi:MAG: hypothetical protein JWO44_625 [Bacteroidetes bacterium]|nr:hypothetical protein [Bacteroidota bacterium]
MKNNDTNRQFDELLDSLSNAELFAIGRNFIPREFIIELLSNSLSESDKSDVLDCHKK